MTETPLAGVNPNGSLPALPDPQTLAAAQVPQLVAVVAEVREALRRERDISGADELRRRLAAYERYVMDKKARAALEAESRRTEVLIGGLLGKPVTGRPKAHQVSLCGLHDRHRHEFREMYRHRKLVERTLASGDTTRAKILREIARAVAATAAPPESDDEPIRLGDFRDVLEDVENESVDLIFTDPPYDKGSMDLYGQIAELGARVLKPGGSLMAYCGQYALPEIIEDMSASLRYWWLCACVHDGGNHKSLPGIKAYVLWKPIVWFVKETNSSDEFVYDAILRPAPEKHSHDWEQSLAEPLHYIEKLCPPGGLVLDPCVGGGTTALAARQLGRRFVGAEIDAAARDRARARVAA